MIFETDDIDDDYFTPVPSTSLANIFATGSKNPDSKSNESLKYTPPKQQSTSQKPDDSKMTQCVFATALVGYEWVDNVYTCRGNLGFAIIKVLKSGLHNIILYDSRKTTLSRACITPTLEVIINKNQSISYYDDLRKYWSLYVNEDSVKSITSILKSFNAQIKISAHTDNNPPEPLIEVNKANTENMIKKDKGSDTDSSINRKTKMSILNRMANMGQSVLPSNVNFNVNTSDSSDTSENITHTKIIRHKPIKSVKKDINNEKNTVVCTPQKIYESDLNQVAISTQKVSDNTSLYTYVNGVLVPVTSANLMTNSIDRNINNMDIFLNEQRVNNTEVRINVNRITDKVDHILQKLNNLEVKDLSGGTVINMQSIYQKLLVEYENKIKNYENLLKTKGLETTSTEDIHNEMDKRLQELKWNITELEQQNQEKDNEISRLGNELNVLKQKVDTSVGTSLNENKDIMLNKIKDLELDLSNKELEVKDITNKYESLLQSKNEYNIEEKIKSIMNNTYKTISGNFENNESYSGENINKIIAVVIRNITLNMLNNETSTP